MKTNSSESPKEMFIRKRIWGGGGGGNLDIKNEAISSVLKHSKSL